MKRNRELLLRLCAGIDVVQTIINEHCICIRYNKDGKRKTAVFPKGRELSKLLAEFDKIDAYDSLGNYKYCYVTNAGEKGAFTMTALKVPVSIAELYFSDNEARELCAIYEYSEALKQAGTFAHMAAKVVELFPSFTTKRIA